MSWPSRLPNLAIIGSMKSGTTSLHYYLNQHPQVFMSRKKELNFFVSEFNWSRGTNWYASNFQTRAKVVGESSPSYTNYPYFDGVPERMHAVVPEMRLIYLIRHPIDRITSEYIHRCATGEECRDINEAVREFEDNRYVTRSMYYFQLAQYLEWYPKSRVLVVTQEQLLADRRATLRTIFRFLEIDDSFESPRFDRLRNRSSDKRRKGHLGKRINKVIRGAGLERLSPSLAWHAEQILTRPFSQHIPRPFLNERVRRKLALHFAPEMARLKTLTGREFSEWSWGASSWPISKRISP